MRGWPSSAGVNEKAGGATDRGDPAGRLRLLLDVNVKVFQNAFPKLAKAAPPAVILVATDPPEPLVDVARQLVSRERVMGVSTYSTACASASMSRRGWP
jgi:L-lactate dehydrogenase